MTLFPSNLCVHRRFILRSFTSRTSNSGGSGGSENLKERESRSSRRRQHQKRDKFGWKEGKAGLFTFNQYKEETVQYMCLYMSGYLAR